MRHALKIDMLLLKSAKTTLRRQTHKIDTIIARLACSTDSVRENFFWFHLAGRPVVQTLTGQVGIDLMTVLKLPKMY